MNKLVKVVLAEGEVTGHAHVATGFGLQFKAGILSITEEALVTHEEHGTRTLLAGEYEVRRVLELDPAGDVEEVRD